MFLFNNFRSFGAVLDLNKGSGPGFDLLRLGLALLILLSHASKLDGHSGFTAALTDLLKQALSIFDGGGHVVGYIPPAPVSSNGTASTGITGPFVRALVPSPP